MTSQDNVTNGVDDKPLYDPQILKDLKFDPDGIKYNPHISPQNPGESLIMRPLCRSDYDKGFVQLLSQLTKVGEVSRELFEAQYERMEATQGVYYVTVIEDTLKNQIIGAATLFIEHKFIHACATRGRIEDVVVNSEYRGKQLGKLLLDVLTQMSMQLGCYKVTLDCRDQMVPFYTQFGFVKEDGQNYMCRRFHD